MDVLEKEIIGKRLTEIFGIKVAKGDFLERRYETLWGTKTDLGIYLTAKRILEGGKIK